MSQRRDISHLTPLVLFAATLVVASKKTFADGKAGLGDIPHVFPVIKAAGPAFKDGNMREALADLADLDQGETEQLKNAVLEKLDAEMQANSNADRIVRAALNAAPYLVAIYDAARFDSEGPPDAVVSEADLDAMLTPPTAEEVAILAPPVPKAEAVE